VFSTYLEFRTMDEVHKPSDSEHPDPAYYISEPHFSLPLHPRVSDGFFSYIFRPNFYMRFSSLQCMLHALPVSSTDFTEQFLNKFSY
jgi:hypothetical protein